MISAKDSCPGMTIVERAATNVDRAALKRMQQDEEARATAERIAHLRHTIFRNTPGDRNVDALTNEEAAARLLISARNHGYHDLIRAILAKAIDRRWPTVVRAILKHFDDNPLGPLIQELWDLTTHRTAV
jgi:hypothetical protein